MPKVKIPRKSTAVDMTAMCDVAFLLLTFFILTTKFKPQEAVAIDIPPSTAQIPLPDKGILKFEIAPDGRVFFGLDDQNTRLAVLDRISSRYQLPFNEEQKNAFKTLETWGMDVRALPKFLSEDPTKRASIQQPGLVMDTLGGYNQIEDLILFAREEYKRGTDENIRIAIKGDKSTKYKAFDKVIQALQNKNVNKFNIITSAKAKQE